MGDVEAASPSGSAVVKPKSKCTLGTACAVVAAVVLVAGILVAVLVLMAAKKGGRVGSVQADFGSASDPGGFAPSRRRLTAGHAARQLYTNAAGEALAPSVLAFGITRIAICRDLVFSGSRVDREVDCLELLSNGDLAEAGDLRNAAGIDAAYDPTSVVGRSLVNFADPAAIAAALATPADVFEADLHACTSCVLLAQSVQCIRRNLPRVHVCLVTRHRCVALACVSRCCCRAVYYLSAMWSWLCDW